MASRKDKMNVFNNIMQAWEENTTTPFYNESSEPQLDYGFLRSLLAIPVENGSSVRSGVFANALDLWLAREFEHAGFTDECIWPRMEEPRAMDPSLVHALGAVCSLTPPQTEMLMHAGGAQKDANVMGSVYTKQVDVGMSNWLSGPEMLVSTKTMSASFGKNLPNRFEEAYGDVKNLRERYPLAAHGFVFLAHASILDEPSAFEKATHMLRQLSRNGEVYDAVALLIAYWDTSADIEVSDDDAIDKSNSWTDVATVTFPERAVKAIPPDLSCEHFFKTIIDIVLANSPVDAHAEARKRLQDAACRE